MVSVLLLLWSAWAWASDFVIEDANREINLEGRFATVKTVLTVKNQGSGTLSKFMYAIVDEEYPQLAHIRSYLETEPYNSFKVELVPSESCCGHQMLKIPIIRGVKGGATEKIVVEETYANKLVPLPEKIGIFDAQFLKYTDNLYVYSPYKVKSQFTSLILPSEQVESYTKPATLFGNILSYGKFSDIQPFTRDILRVHYEHSAAIPYFTKVEREIEVSHWGNIAVLEKYWLVNRGAELSGEFNRVDYTSRLRPSAMNALEYLEATLPRTAWGLSFRDEIGNISTSNARKHMSYSYLNVQPRFPIMGGWKSNWEVGYNLPIKYFVKQKDDMYMLNMTFGFAFKNIIAEEFTVRVVLPEGAYDLQHILPFVVDSVQVQELYSYLDVTSRPVLVFHKKNAVDFHRKPFQVLYKFNSLRILGEPLMMSGLVFGLLSILIVYFRFRLKLDKHKKIN